MDCHLVTVSDAINPSSKCWRKDVLQRVVSPEEVNKICAIPIAVENRHDHLIWHHDPKRTYSVKSGYHVEVTHQQRHNEAKPSSSFQIPALFWKFLWALPTPPKLRHFW